MVLSESKSKSDLCSVKIELGKMDGREKSIQRQSGNGATRMVRSR